EPSWEFTAGIALALRRGKAVLCLSLLRDNAPTERLFRSFKTEWMPLDGYEDLAQARVDVASYILGYYCQVRPHHFNNYLTPVEKEKQFFSENLLDAV
ncbi:integrase core domain-containing protein, partial [Streptococcus pyogenes]